MIKQKKARSRGAALVTLLLVTATGSAQDWSNCASDLDDLRRRAGDASSAAQETDAMQQKFKSIEDELRQCAQFPQVHDLLRDGCRSRRSERDFARVNYQNQLVFLKSALDDVNSKIRSASSSCGYEMTSTLGSAPTVPAGVQRPEQCAVYLRYKGSLPLPAILDVCSKQMPPDQCRKCLE